MAWYYYSGRVVRAIPQTRTKSVAVRPNTKVEILEVTKEVQALISQGVLRRTGRPVGATSVADKAPQEPVRMQDVVQKSSLAMHFAEKGMTESKDMPPRKSVGKPEFTVHEVASAEAAPPEAAAELPAAPAAKSSKKKMRHGH